MLNTVNVIEISDTLTMAVQQLRAFNDNHDGNAEAEKLFVTLIQEQNEGDVDDETIDDALENGYYEQGTYYVCLVHSTHPNG